MLTLYPLHRETRMLAKLEVLGWMTFLSAIAILYLAADLPGGPEHAITVYSGLGGLVVALLMRRWRRRRMDRQ